MLSSDKSQSIWNSQIREKEWWLVTFSFSLFHRVFSRSSHNVLQFIEQRQLFRKGLSKLWLGSSREVGPAVPSWQISCTALPTATIDHLHFQDTQVFTSPNLTVTISCHEMWWVSFLQEIPQIRHSSLNPQFPREILGKAPPFPPDKIRQAKWSTIYG